MTDVFISYAREDQPQAERIARGLEAMGLSAFWDNEIPPGQTWADYIEGKLNQCAVAVVLWSQHSTKSQWVREEARMGRAKLIPARLDAAEAPFGFGDVQSADLSQWSGDYAHPDWRRFANAVYARARGAAAPQSAQQQQAWQAPPQQQGGAASGQAHQSGAGEQLSPLGYIQKCLRLYVDGKGRARRREYGWFVLAWVVFAIVAMMIDMSIFGFNSYTSAPNGYLVSWLGLAFLAPGISAASRRAHDFGQSGWLAILTVVPYIGWIAALVFIFIPGQPGANRYGPDPKAA